MLTANGQRLRGVRLGCAEVVARLFDERQRGQRDRDLGVILAHRLPADLQRAFGERFRALNRALGDPNFGESRQPGGDVRVAGAQPVLQKLEAAFRQLGGRLKLAAYAFEMGHREQAPSDIGIVRPRQLLVKCERAVGV